MDTIRHQIAVIGPVIVATTNRVTPVSVTIRRPVVQDNISQEIVATPVIRHHQMRTIPPLEHVIGAVVLDILDQETPVSVTQHTVA